MSWKSYDAGETGEDQATERKEKPVRDNCPQRGTRPKLDLSPDNSYGDFSETHLPQGDFYEPGWQTEKINDCMLDYGDKPAIDNNEAVRQRRDWDFYGHGWRLEAGEALPGGESGSSNKASNTPENASKPRAGKPV